MESFMKTIKNNIFIKIYILAFCHMQIMHADTMTVLNSTSQKITINFETEFKEYKIEAIPSENLYHAENLDNQSNQYDNPLAHINYDHSQIKKIIIHRTNTSMPQIIYYNGEHTSNDHNNIVGLYGAYVSHASAIKVSQDSVIINDLSYNINDTSSFAIKCKSIKKVLNNGLQDTIQKEVDDLSESIRLIEQSDMAMNYSFQATVIKSDLDTLINQIKVMKEIQQYSTQLDYLIESVGSDNVDVAKKLLNNMVIALEVLDTSNTQNKKNINNITTKMASLRTKINSIEQKMQLKRIPMMVEQQN